MFFVPSLALTVCGFFLKRRRKQARAINAVFMAERDGLLTFRQLSQKLKLPQDQAVNRREILMSVRYFQYLKIDRGPWAEQRKAERVADDTLRFYNGNYSA